MTFKDWISLFELDAHLMSTDKMGSTPYDAAVGKYEIDDNLYVPDNAEIELISRWVAQTAGMYWAFKKTVRDALYHKAFAEAAKFYKRPFSQDGQLDPRVLGYICQQLRLNSQQCHALAGDHRNELRHIASQLAAA